MRRESSCNRDLVGPLIVGLLPMFVLRDPRLLDGALSPALHWFQETIAPFVDTPPPLCYPIVSPIVGIARWRICTSVFGGHCETAEIPEIVKTEAAGREERIRGARDSHRSHPQDR